MAEQHPGEVGFSVFARTGNACLGGPGSLYVRKGEVELVPGLSLHRATGVERVVSRGPRVQIFHPRFAAPWVNTHRDRRGSRAGRSGVGMGDVATPSEACAHGIRVRRDRDTDLDVPGWWPRSRWPSGFGQRSGYAQHV